MNEMTVRVPEIAFPKKDPEHPCACQFRPFSLRDLQGMMIWVKKPGACVRQGEILFEAEVSFKMLEFPSPAGGTLDRILIRNGEYFRAGDPVCTLTEN